MKLSIIIVNYNVKYYLEQCLYSVLKAIGKINAEIIVVDNNSTDGSQKMLKEKFPQVKYIFNKKNVGFSKANNQALEISKAEYALLLNPDTLVDELTFEKVISFMDKNPDAGGLGVKMINGKGDYLPESKRGFPTPATAFYRFSGLSKLFQKSKVFNRYHLGHLDKESSNEIEVLAGAFMLLRMEVLNKIGFLDEDFFMYGEDIDLSYRITQSGFKNYYFPETSILHYKGESTKKASINYVKMFYNAMLIFSNKHFTSNNFKYLFYLIYIGIYLKAFFALIIRFGSFIGRMIRKPLRTIGLRKKKVLFIGDIAESESINDSEDLINIYGTLTPDKTIKKHPGYIGSFTQLKDISKIYKADELIFSTTDIRLIDILEKMEETKKLALKYKFSHKNSDAILGSSSVLIT